jgi:thiamine biosynthesis protein ThiI
MQFVVKYFSEIVMKSRPVRRQFVRRLEENLAAVLREIDPDTVLHRGWDKLRVEPRTSDTSTLARMVRAMCNTPGVTLVLETAEHQLGTLDTIVEHVLPVYAERLAGRTFAVRCKRSGQHTFSSLDVEREVGGALLARTQATGVNLTRPDVTVEVEISRKSLFIVSARHRGLGGFPVGSLDPVLSLMSGGFDSPVASYLTMKRGMRTHFVFFQLGGRDQELRVKEVALHLWQQYGGKQRVLFITVPFEEVVAELLHKVHDSYMGVVLKRMMLRVADRLAEELQIDALVTGECVAQVSSQTLRNLSVIDSVTDRLVLRPLVATDKEDIMRIAQQIGTANFAATMPEYCGVISVRPTTRARLDRTLAQERYFDMAILDQAMANRRQSRIDELAADDLQPSAVEVLSVPLAHGTIIDIRHPNEEELAPLRLHVPVLKIPFYELHTRAGELASGNTYLLYCGRGIMSRLHAGRLMADTALDIKVYAPRQVAGL